MTVLEIENAVKLYRGRNTSVTALRGVTLRVESGDFLAVRGPSGSGKTTLLMIAGGLLAPDEGRVLVDGDDLYRLTPNGRAGLRSAKIGFVFQQFHLVPYLDCLENVLAPTMAGAAPSGEEKARRLLEEMNLGERLHHRPPELSTGERQRVALARALVNDPSIIMADEPTGNLDEANAREVLDRLAGFARRGGTVLMVSHGRDTTAGATRLVTLEKGQVVEEIDEPGGPAGKEAPSALARAIAEGLAAGGISREAGRK